MKNAFLSAMLCILLIAGCAKNSAISDLPPAVDWETVQKGVNVPGSFDIQIKKNMLNIFLQGNRDAMGRFFVKGRMTVENEKTEYSCYYDRNSWYDDKGKPLETEEPVNPVMFIENLVLHTDYVFLRQERGMNVFSFKANAGVIDPIDPVKDGVIYIEKGSGYVRAIEISGASSSITVNMTPSMFSVIKIPGRNEQTIKVNASNDDIEKMDYRLRTFGQGYADKAGLHIFDNEDMEFVMQDSLRLFGFAYIEQYLEDSNTVYMYGDMRNTLKTTEQVYSFRGSEDVVIINKGPYYEMSIHGGPFPVLENMCVLLGRNAIRAESVTQNEIRILKIPERFIRELFVLIKYPIDKSIKKI